MLELVDVVGRLGREDLDGVLVADVIGALDRVERVLLGAVFSRVAESCVDTAFSCAGMASGRMELRYDPDVGACVVGLNRGAHTCAAGSDHEHIVHGFHVVKVHHAAAHVRR